MSDSLPTVGLRRASAFATLLALTAVAFRGPLARLIQFSFDHEHYSHIVLIPAISVALVALERKRIFSRLETSWPAAFGVLLAGVLVAWLGGGYAASGNENDRLSVAMLAVVLVGVGSFILCFGLPAFGAARFPLLLLFFMVPIPSVLLDRVIGWLQTSSADVSYAVFQLLGVPVFRTGQVFSLPGLTIEVAKECSGIRSSLALLLTTLLAGHVFLRSSWAKAALVVIAIPMLVVKNGIRIVTLSLLSIYVDPTFISGRLHHDGGIIFFLLALGLLAPVLWSLEKSERIGPGGHRQVSKAA